MINKERKLTEDSPQQIRREIWTNIILPDYVVDEKDLNENTDLMCACYLADISLVKKLLFLHSNVNLINNTGLNCILLTAWGCVNNNQELGVEILDCLYKAGANLDMQDIEGQTGLIISCLYKDMEKITKKFVDLDCNLNLQTKQGNTALISACENPSLECIYFLCASVKTLEQINNFKVQVKTIVNNDYGIIANSILNNMELNLKLNQELINKGNIMNRIKI